MGLEAKRNVWSPGARGSLSFLVSMSLFLSVPHLPINHLLRELIIFIHFGLFDVHYLPINWQKKVVKF